MRYRNQNSLTLSQSLSIVYALFCVLIGKGTYNLVQFLMDIHLLS